MKMTVAFVTLGLEFDGNSLRSGSMGGSESALIYMAREFAKLGHDVRVFCECRNPGKYDGVSYYHHSSFIPQSVICNYDILIASRWMEFLTAPTNAGLRALWLHDTPSDINRLMTGLWQTDLVLGLSDYHIEEYCKKIPELREHFWKTMNGVDLELIDKCRKPKIENKLIFTSRPERGLAILLEKIFPRLLQAKPDLQLYYCNYTLGNIQLPQHIVAQIYKTEQLAKMYGERVRNIGNLNKEALYHQISSSKLWIAPTDFCEISCISMIEAQACGTPIVSTNDYAIKETVENGKTGILIDGDPNSKEYQDAFVEKTLQLLDDKAMYDMMVDEGPRSIRNRGYSWSDIARSWEHKFTTMMQERYDNNKRQVLLSLIRQSDLVPAKILAESTGESEILDVIKSSIKNMQDDTPSNTQDVIAGWKEAVPLFNMCGELMRNSNVLPKKVLDYNASSIAFGLYFKKALPSCEVTILAKDHETKDNLQAYAKESNLDVKVITSDETTEVSGFYDLIFFGDHIDQLESPKDFLNMISKSLISKDGWFVITTRNGAEQATVPQDHTRCWNLGYQDFADMFQDCKNFTSTFIDNGISNGGDLKGHWIVCVQPTELIKQPNLQRRKLITRPYQTLAVCMIVKDEEDWLRGCVKTFKDVADHIVICDTGSTDSTLSIIADLQISGLPLDLRKVPFDNFSQARNASIDNLKEDWILWLDADEKLIEPQNIRKYLNSVIYNGYSVRQVHLMRDLQGTSDIPVRLLRNKPYYRFSGYIHEHCLDQRLDPFEDPISPAMVLEDTELAHYGYITERVRRAKCSNRNMALLLRDVEENGKNGRELSWVLLIRDFLNTVKWNVEKEGFPIRAGSESHARLNAVVDCYYEHFATKEKSRYKNLAFPMYQEALQVLGISQLPAPGSDKPPFEVGFALVGGQMGLQPESRKVGVQGRWCLNDDEFFQFLQEQGAQLMVQMDGSRTEKYKKYLHTEESDLPYSSRPQDANKLLASGVGIQPQARS